MPHFSFLKLGNIDILNLDKMARESEDRDNKFIITNVESEEEYLEIVRIYNTVTSRANEIVL